MPVANSQDDRYKDTLSSEQYEVLRRAGTEPPFSGKLLYNQDKGQYRCAACGAIIFVSTTKYDSGSGWPSFNDAVPGAVKLAEDNSHDMHRIEVSCARCGSHLGHLFDDPNQPTGKDYCINSVAMTFEKSKKS
ncbi:MAG TPA: peptide-methionine (R)-S-oxide reductase MsrB [Candidatus Saccharimonadales bacterium]|nr:peptide-methionine (R)-S-oxide reductase MsrB [Candidatus Saccharimonadales bacterium]